MPLAPKGQDADDDRLTVMAMYCQAMMHAQTLELTLGQLLHLQKVGDEGYLPRDEAWERIRKILQATAGQVAKQLQLSENLARQVKSAVRTRNHLAHDFFVVQPRRWETDPGRKELFAELIAAARVLYRATEALEPVVDGLMRELGAKPLPRVPRTRPWDLVMQSDAGSAPPKD